MYFSFIDNFKVLENIKQQSARTITCNEHRSDIIRQPKTNDLDYLIDATFRNINRLFVLKII